MIGRALAAATVVLVTCAILLLGPIHATGVRGTALRPHYVSFYVGFYSYAPLAGSAGTKAALAQAGITAPSVAVRRRREAAAGAAIVAALMGGILVAGNRRERRRPPAW